MKVHLVICLVFTSLTFCLHSSSEKEIVDATTNKKVKIQKMVRKLPWREIHNQILEPVADGGFRCARDSTGKVQISLTSLERRQPNWVVKMTDYYKQMCCCNNCNEPESKHKSLRLVIGRIIRLLEKQPWGSDDPRYVPKDVVNEYKRQVMIDGTLPFDKGELKDDNVFKGACGMACEREEVNGKLFHRVKCILQECPDCMNK